MDEEPRAAGVGEKAAVVALAQMGNAAPCASAARIDEAGSALAVIEGVAGLLAGELLKAAAAELARWEERGIRVLTVLDPDYPQNLQAVYDRPPLLFVAGKLEARDIHSVAVIGSRRASPDGLARARAITRHLIEAGYAIVSGLAAGVDTAAHTTALEQGGRTVAVLGTGVGRVYPPQNAALQEEIGKRGAVISQFLPDEGPSRENFPRRNALMSGLALATVIAEATQASGARIQARAALAHGRPVLLASQLLDQPWARTLATRPGVYVIASPSELDAVLADLSGTDSLVA